MSEREREKLKIKTNDSGTQCFHHNSPRPPVLAEERTSSPGLTPKRSFACYSDVLAVPTGYETKNSLLHQPCKQRSAESCSQPACLKWASALRNLLQDPDGVHLFKSYLQTEGDYHADALDFWFACQGLRQQTDASRICQLVRAIFRRYFLKKSFPFSDELKKRIGRQVKEILNNADCHHSSIFDEAQYEVEKAINATSYPNFITSETYLQYVQAVHNNEIGQSSGSSSSSSSNSAREIPGCNQSSGLLPTVHEDTELITESALNQRAMQGSGRYSGYHTPRSEPMRLTKDSLLVTQRWRACDVRPQPEAYAGKMYASSYMHRQSNGPYHHTLHAAYSSYNPVSRQDSELQSRSSHSDIQTESDSMSLTDSSVDGVSLHRSSRRYSARQARAVLESASLNRDPHMHQTLIPRTQRLDSKLCQPMDPDKFAAELIEKLEIVKKQLEAREKLNRKLMLEEEIAMPAEEVALQEKRFFTVAMKEKLQMDDDNDQAILDQHVSRVWSDQTPCRSPGLKSPRPHSPSNSRWLSSSSHQPSRRRNKDVVSTLSADSGNIADFSEGVEHKTVGVPKSRSMPDYADHGDHPDRYRHNASRRSSKKTLNDLTDSGVSVLSDTPPVPSKENRGQNWLKETGHGTSHAQAYSEMKYRTHRPSTTATSPNASRHKKTFSTSRSSSLERREPAQPFVGDPKMPLLPQPHTPTQLDEAVRRLIEDEQRNKLYKLRASSGKSHQEMQSTQSTLRKPSRQSRLAVAPGACHPSDDFTTVMFSFCEEQVPYRTKIPGRQVTLRQFKDVMPKKGNYRYFFKTECEELDNQVIQEELNMDSDIVPLFEGKVMAQVKPVDG